MLMVAPSGIVKDEIFLDTPTFFGQRINRHRNGRIRRCSRKCECHNREKFLDEPNRIQTCKDLEQDLIYAETLNSQCQQYTDHILRQRDKCTETDIRKCTADQTEYTDWGKAHDHHGHFHHDIIKLAEEVCNCLCSSPIFARITPTINANTIT